MVSGTGCQVSLNIGNIEHKLSETVGAVTLIEVIARAIGEISGPVKNELKKISERQQNENKQKVDEKWEKNFVSFEKELDKKIKNIDGLKELTAKFFKNGVKKGDDNFETCSLDFLLKAIMCVYHDKITPEEKKLLESFRSKIRNNVIHVNFFSLIDSYLGSDVKRYGETLKRSEYTRSVIISDGSGVFERCRVEANQVSTILKKILQSL